MTFGLSGSGDENTGPHTGRPLHYELRIQSANCIQCGLCQRDCKFLQQYGSPKEIADHCASDNTRHLQLSFACSLCGLCAAVCPINLDPSAMFLAMRREAASRNEVELSVYRAVLNYERLGLSRLLTCSTLPDKCSTVLFPGCALPGTRPQRVKELYLHLQGQIPDLGLVLYCCSKPSHDLGRHEHFLTNFNKLKDHLLHHGVRKVLVACPNCHRVFKQYGSPLTVSTVYESMAVTPQLPEMAQIGTDRKVTIHDPCGTRDETGIHHTIRILAQTIGLQIEEMRHRENKTICCGEGGSVGCVNSGYASNWGKRRGEEAGGTRIVTYCAGCTNFLGRVTPTSHILDLLFAPQDTLADKVKVAKSPWTYINRLLLANYFKKLARRPGKIKI